MHDAGRHLWAQQRAQTWSDRHASEMSLVLALQAAGYSRDESRRMAARHMAGEPIAPITPIMPGHNGGPVLND